MGHRHTHRRLNSEVRRPSFRLGRTAILLMGVLAMIPTVAVAFATFEPTTSVAGAAGTGETGLITISPSNQTRPTGSPQTYTINLSCQGTAGGQCGPDLQVTIPLDTSTTPSMTDPSWIYAATSTPAGLLASGPTVVGTNLVVTLDPTVFIGGFSGSISLTATPPGQITPNNTTWTMNPTLSGTGIPSVSVPTPATSTATAAPKVAVTKATADGGSVYTAGSVITYSITTSCSTNPIGGLELQSASLVDPLPAGLTYVSSTPTGATYDPITNTVRWDFDSSDLSTMPAGCTPGATGPTTFTVTTTAPDTVPVNPLLNNKVTFSGTGPDAQVPAGVSSSGSAQVPVQIILDPNPGPGPGYATITKSSLAPIAQPGITSGNQYVGTYSGNWLPPSSSPSYGTTAAAAMYQINVAYGLVNTYQTDLVDPVPCLTAPSGNVYNSPSPTGPTCTSPAFLTQVIQVNAPGWDPTVNGLGQAYTGGWRPIATLADGSTITLSANGTVNPGDSRAYFTIPTGAVVSAIRLPPDPALRNKSLQLTLWGYADPSLAGVNAGLNQLHNTATATPEITPGTPLAPISASADIFTIPTKPQLGISKQFGSPGAGPRGSTVLNIVGSVTTNSAVTKDVVITDLLPTGITWANPVTSGTWTVKQGGAAGSTSTPVTAVTIDNYQGSGRQLVRFTVPSSSLAGAGTWTLTPPANFFLVTTPTALGAYLNTDQIFLAGSQLNAIQDTCATPTQVGGGISSATYQSDNAQDLAGDGQLHEAYCQNAAILTIQGTGAAFALTKTVQGNLDAIPRGALGIGTASPGGTGTFTLNWVNVGSNLLGQPVVYDLLPHPGDTGVSQGQSTVARDSQFTPLLSAIGALPAGVTVEYSTASNPCRNEVFPDAANPGCVNDWTADPPANLGTVQAIRFVSVATYPVGQGFTVSFTMTVPPTDINAIAWNSAATNANDITNPSNHPLPAEPPKVGILAPVAPVIATQTSTATTTAYGQLSDQVEVAGTGGGPGALAWTLVGPVEPIANSCTGVDWTGAPVAASGSVDITGDGPVTVGPATLGGGGCYSWGETLSSTNPQRPYQATSDPGQANESTIVTHYPPSVVTTAELTIDDQGTRTLHDHVAVSDIPAAAPAPTPLTWTLFGPVAPSADRSCAGQDWSGASVAFTGSVVVTGNGTYDTPGEVLSTPGCYSYAVSLPATADSPAVSEAAGLPGETVLIAEPEIITATSADVAALWSSSADTVTITGTEGGTGSLAWSLVGPVDPVNDTCATVNWIGAATVASGSLAVTGDGTYTTDQVETTAPGCYSWTEVLTSATFPSPTTVDPGAPQESFLVERVTPTMVTTAALTTAPALTVSDSVTVSGTGVGSNSGAPTSNAITWALFGPLRPNGSSCVGLTWTGAPIVDVGSLEVLGDGTLHTPAVPVLSPGCYTFEEQLAGTSVATEVISTAGQEAETVLLAAPSPVPPDAGGSHITPATGPVTPSQTLAMTGGDLGRLLFLGIALVLGGAILQVRRRRSTTTPGPG